MCSLASYGPGLGLDGMGNICELLINIVKQDEPKMLTGSTQNGAWSGAGIIAFPVMDEVPPVNREVLTHPVTKHKHGKPVILPSG